MAVISMKQLLEAGVHFGHQTRRWNPKMDKYIFTERNGIYIIDLQKTVKKVDEAYEFVKSVADQGGKMLFVGTKKQAQDAIKEEAERSGQYYINHRWLGGTLTNYKTIKGRIDRIAEIEKMEADGVFEVLPKKEVIELRKEYDKLVKFLGGIREMKGMPDAIFVVDPKKEHNAIAEAKKLGIPVVGIVDTNCDPDDVDYVIPANDDAIRAVKLLTAKMADAFVAYNEGNIEEAEEVVADASHVLDELKADFDNRYKRLQADFENFKRRTNQEKEQLAGYVKGDVLTDLLPVLDNFERAVQSPAEGDAKVFLDGFIMIHQNLMAMLSKHGLAVIDAVGKPFDPNFHQAIMRVPSDEYESDTVCEVLQTGYTVDGRCIRPAMVKVVE